ncbi:MAG: hypothetical protein OEZ23_00775 [Gammaproteobacteria bacterium]|nr:hypothetical protein [Gammaproteobacteria bacterium]
MSLSIRIDESRALLVVRFSADASITEAKQAYPRLFEMAAFRPGINSLWDFRRVKICHIPLSEIRRLVRFIHELAPARGEGYYTALVAGSALDYHLLNTYMLFIRTIGDVKIKVINQDMREAGKWLNKRSEERLKVYPVRDKNNELS